MRNLVFSVLISLAPGACLTGCDDSQGPAAPSDLTPAIAPRDLAETQAALIQNGENDVTARGCPKCHQSGNTADGVLSGGSSPVPGTMIFPPNLTPDPDTGLSDWSDAQIIRAMRQGIDLDGRTMCWVMPHWQIGNQEAAEIVAYLRSLKPVMRDIPLGPCPPAKPTPDGWAP